MTLAFTVFGEAIPQGSMKGYVVNGRVRITSDNPRLKSWRQLVAEAARHELQRRPEAERRLMLDAVRVTVAFYLPRPKSLPRRVTANLKRPDIDKAVRGIFDSLTGVVYRDDSQVVELVAGKFYAAIGQVPHVDVRVEPTSGITLAHVPAAPLPLFAEVGAP